MSANYWTICPKCKQKADADFRIQLEETLREDYEIGIRNGYFIVDYSGSCQCCGFRFEHLTKLDVEKERRYKMLGPE